jgi:hypothetical protein
MKVKIGDKIELFNQSVVVTEELVKEMPEKFEVVDEPLKFEKGKVYKIVEGSGEVWLIRVNCFVNGEIHTCSSFCKKPNTYYNGKPNLWGDFKDNDKILEITPEDIALLEEQERKHGYEYNPDAMELEELPKDGEVWTFEHNDGDKAIARISDYYDHEGYIGFYGAITFTGNFSLNNSFGRSSLRKYKGGDPELAEAAKKEHRVWDEKKKEYVDIKPLFITEDGVKVFKSGCTRTFLKSTDGRKAFSTKEAAEKWVKDNKVKSFRDYEKEFLRNKYGLSETCVNNSEGYAWLIKHHPKQYYSIIGQHIANELNGGWKPDWNDSVQTKYGVHFKGNKYKTFNTYSVRDNNIHFKSYKLVEQFIEIMGDKLNYLY